MSENSKQADESGRVATGDAAAPPPGSTTEPDTAPGAGNGATNGSGTGTGAGAPAVDGAAETDAADTGGVPAPATAAAEAPTGARPAVQTGPGAQKGTAAQDGPAAQNGAGAVDTTKPAGAKPLSGNGSPYPTPSPTARPVPTPRPAEETVRVAPVADPSGVPAPGPNAETPPPWQRMPGSEPVGSAPPPVADNPSVAGGLFDGPTAYMDPADGGRTTEHPGPGGPAISAAPRRPRQAALQLRRLDPWSVLKLALVLAVVIFFIWMVAVGVLYGVLDGMGVWDRLNGTYNDLVSGEAQTGSALISAGRVFGIAAVIGAINSLLFAVAMTIGAFVYNVSADLVGGVEVTLSERD
ncbi:DUF3566 domain-containing protein [Pseudonocardia sp. N23]|uniref:DUF3566 domain-containing protein n=1 Tax=Pseudonocardia sp. N23 TaxID=1987376 RepID=UPI000C0236D8|nr:hypothetical protein TOK_3908 [Pseudonocardia sp. N23]